MNHPDPGDDEREAQYWERQGFDWLTRVLLFKVFPALLVGMLGVLWWVSEKA